MTMSKRKVLIIDDEPIMCKHLADVLSDKYDMEVNITQNYSNMERYFKLGSYSVVVLDIMMPYDKEFFSDIQHHGDFPELSTGQFLFHRIRHKYPQLPILFYTARRQGIECDGRSMVLNKPNLAVNVAKTINDFITRCEKIE